MTTPVMYLRRTKERTWHFFRDCPNYPLNAHNSNGIIATMEKPAGDFCPECVLRTKDDKP